MLVVADGLGWVPCLRFAFVGATVRGHGGGLAATSGETGGVVVGFLKDSKAESLGKQAGRAAGEGRRVFACRADEGGGTTPGVARCRGWLGRSRRWKCRGGSWIRRRSCRARA